DHMAPTGRAAGVRCAESSAGLVPAPDATSGICRRQLPGGTNPRLITVYQCDGGATWRTGAAGCRLWAALLNALYRVRSTAAGFWPSAVNVPMRPSTTVAATAPAAAASNGPGGQAKGRFIILTITKAAAAEPAAIPNIAVARPSARYSSA